MQAIGINDYLHPLLYIISLNNMQIFFFRNISFYMK